MKKILIILVFPIILYSQWFNPPYRLTPIDTIYGNILAKGSFFKKGKTDYVGFTNQTISKFNRLMRITKSNGELIDIIIPKRKILSRFFVVNIDKDSLDELIFGASGQHKLELYTFNEGKKNNFFSLNIPKRYFNGKFIAIPVKNHPEEIIIIIVSVLPDKGSLRGMFRINLKTKKILWKRYFADAISEYYQFKKNNKNLLALFSYARNEKLFYANGKFIYKRNEPNVKVDITAPDFSCDSISTLKIYDISNGSLIYKKRIAGLGVKVKRFGEKIKGYDLLLNFKQYSFANRQTDKLVGFKKNDFSLTTLLKYPHRVQHNQVVSMLSNTIVQKNDSIAVITKNEKLTEVKLRFPPLTKIEDFLKTQIGYIYLAKSVPGSTLYDENQKILSKSNTNLVLIDSKKNIYAGSFYINGIKKTLIYHLQPLFILDRISAKGFLYILMLILFLSFFLFSIWSGTIWFSFIRIKKQNQDLEQMTTKLLQAEKLSALGTIAGSIAHQINSPLGAILNASERLKKQGLEDKNVELIYNAGERIKVIIQKFLLSTRKETSKNVNFNDVFERWYSLFSKDFAEQGIKIKTEIKNGDVSLPLTWDELNELINNTMFNARDSVILANPAGEREIKIKTELQNSKFIISIEDNGLGFDKKYLKDGIKIFNTTKEKGKGTGLGLWIIDTILKKIGGKIELKNGENGAIVLIKIPVAKNE